MFESPRLQGIEQNSILNYVINGGLDYWQRKVTATFTGNGANENYVADRFRRSGAIADNPTMNMTVERVTDIPSALVNEIDHSMKLTNNAVIADVTTSTTDVFGMNHVLEKTIMKPLIGKKVKVSFWAKANSAKQYSFVSGAFDGSYQVVQELNVTTQWTRYEYSLDFSNGTYGSSNSDPGAYFLVELYHNGLGAAPGPGEFTPPPSPYRGLPTQDNFFDAIGNELFLTGFMMREDKGEEYEVPFKRYGRDLREELLGCQRYYEVIPTSALLWQVDSSNTTRGASNYQYQAAKRAIPVLQANFDLLHINGGNSATCTALASSIYGTTNGQTSGSITVDFWYRNNNPVLMDCEL